MALSYITIQRRIHEVASGGNSIVIYDNWLGAHHWWLEVVQLLVIYNNTALHL